MGTTVVGAPERRFRTEFPDRAVERVAARMLDLRDLYGPAECWPWPRSRTRGGYGQLNVQINGTKRTLRMLAHRVAWVAAGYALPSDLTIDHQCKNPPCINPSHMRLLTMEANSADSRANLERQARTHCPQGHEYTPENTYYRPDRPPGTGRMCWTCIREKSAERRRRGLR